MASIQLQTSIASLLFSSQIPDEIEVTTDISTVTFYLSSSSTQLIELQLDSYDGKITIYDLRSIIEEYMIDNGLTYLNVNLYSELVDDVSINRSFSVIFCSCNIDEEVTDFTSNYFLTSLLCKRSCKSADERLSYYGTDSPTCNARVMTDGKFSLLSASLSASGTDIKTIDCGYSAIVSLFGIDTSTTQLLSATINAGNRSFTLFYTDETPQTVLLFNNVFNCPEYCHIIGEVTEKSKTEKSEAISNGIKTFYDKTDTLEKEVNTAPLLPDEANWMQQLCQSSKVYELPVNNANSSGHEVNITDYTCEVSDSSEEVNKLKLTYQYKNTKPKVHLPSPSTQIFTQEYNNEFQ